MCSTIIRPRLTNHIIDLQRSRCRNYRFHFTGGTVDRFADTAL